jgi:hypothetical protein
MGWENQQTGILHMNSRMTSRQSLILAGVIVAWVFLFHFQLIMVLYNKYASIDNDFYILYYYYKPYLLAHLVQFTIPMWFPVHAAGYPFFSDPFTQTFYPLNILLALVYAVQGGYTPLDHQIFTVSGIALFGVGLFLWLKQFRLSPQALLFTSLIMPVSFKITEILRFPNAVHTAAWYPWILFSLTAIMKSQSRKQAAGYGALLWFSLTCLLTGGYPYYIYYAIFLFPPYLLVFLISPLCQRFFGEQVFDLKRAILVMGIATALALVIVSPYLVNMARLLSQTTDRGGGNFEYSTAHIFNWEDTLGSLFFPPAAQAEGWYYFGLANVLLIFFYVISTSRLFKSKTDTPDTLSEWYYSGWVKGFLLGWVGIIIYLSWGKNSELFKWLWVHMPGFSSLRSWGRLNIILVPILSLLVAIAYTHFENFLIRPRHFYRALLTIGVLMTGYLAILSYQVGVFNQQNYDYYWITYFQIQPQPQLFIVMGLISFMMVFSTLLVSLVREIKSAAPVIGLLTFLSAADVRGGIRDAWMWNQGGVPPPDHVRLDINRDNAIAFKTPRRSGLTFSIPYVIDDSGVYENWYFARYNHFLAVSEWEQPARDRLLGIDNGQKIYFSSTITATTATEFMADSDAYSRKSGFQYELISYTGDELHITVDSKAAGYLSFIDNWDAGWQAQVDGQAVSIDLLFGTFKSIRLPGGQHDVIFMYRPTLW